MQLPPSFRDRPSAAKHFDEIIRFAIAKHPFYRQRFQDDEEIPILDMETTLRFNAIILNGHRANWETSGSTGVPVEIAKSPDRHQLDREDENRLVQWLGGRRKRSLIIYPPDPPWPDDLMDISRPIDALGFHVSNCLTYPWGRTPDSPIRSLLTG
ncbi:unnamed protein product [Hapterophycus canaliculatus]